MRIKSTMNGLTPYKPGKPIEEVKRELQLEEVIKLASNENPYGASPAVKDALIKAYDAVHIYPDGYAKQLREDVAQHLNVAEEQLIFGNGSDEVILILCRAMLTGDDNIVTAAPTFPQYKHNAVIEGSEVKEVPLIDGTHDLDGMLQAIDEKTKIVFVCNPNNPTGTYISEEAFRSFMQKVPEDVLVVSDEAYYEYVSAEDFPDTVPYLNEYNNLMLLRTFSKAYGIASLRVGFGAASKDLIQAIDPAREPFNTSTAGQLAASAALNDQSFIRSCFEQNRREMKKYEQFCDEFGLDYFPSETNFILMDLQKPGSEIFQYLLERGFITRNGEALGYPTSVRITLGNPEQNDRIIAELKDWLR
ncbi:histidinol-phosphate transaminase [Salisediminibacterium halotolerans]|uniref:histidinol-phosphate transaminase n=1 Tax=Salisediminibacterium halotolerans TaxID=517425 RepID=UPI000EB4FC0A|nr:histidinol-phosphate transaminase [Salisediminibacterium halotolerans]RLJ77933.1 histidinol-phosphate aminotransferase [Actinophytocola xinjiangensis]RPE88729.1 histidinol-phosphate aminotransferase [Salisediminibacterium halotolerans]TWG36910.1 histidinol-phosphate aminotransferase [Salisediminibacterium halotolerans]GEL07404.1 histidinol-phosphate aminotransferase [Salisediminibacterium halotolerans]